MLKIHSVSPMKHNFRAVKTVDVFFMQNLTHHKFFHRLHLWEMQASLLYEWISTPIVLHLTFTAAGISLPCICLRMKRDNFLLARSLYVWMDFNGKRYWRNYQIMTMYSSPWFASLAHDLDEEFKVSIHKFWKSIFIKKTYRLHYGRLIWDMVVDGSSIMPTSFGAIWPQLCM